MGVRDLITVIKYTLHSHKYYGRLKYYIYFIFKYSLTFLKFA